MKAVKSGTVTFLAGATAILFSIMVLSVVWQVFAREVTKNPAAWTEELAKYTFVWTALVGATLVFAGRGHIAVTFVVERLPLPVRKVIAALIQLVILFFAVVILVIGGLGAAQNTWAHSMTALPGTIGMAYLILPVTGVLIAVIALVQLVEDLRGEGPLTVENAHVAPDVPVPPGLQEGTADGLLTEQTPTGDDAGGPSAPATDPKEK